MGLIMGLILTVTGKGCGDRVLSDPTAGGGTEER
jgi:hypothetical protein